MGHRAVSRGETVDGRGGHNIDPHLTKSSG